jgi:N-acetylglucosamine-6-phosphate deacetylase
MIALTASRLYTPLELIEQPVVLIDGDRVTQVGPRDSITVPPGVRLVDLGDAVLAPGFVDIHIHGGAGHDVMEADAAGLLSVQQFLAKHGVTSYLPTTVTAPLDQTLTALERLADAIEKAAGPGAHPLGIHLEGPFISHARRGVHPPENLLPPTLSTFERFWQASRGQIKVMTIAPELDGAREVIAEAARRGVCVSLGHSDADLHAARAAVEAGARHATHAFNAMRPLNHRDPGIVGEMLTDPRLSADIIADGIHVDPTVVGLFLKAKGPDASVLITDATAATGMPDGRYRLGAFEVEVRNGMCTADGKLAGSVLTMDRAVRNAMKFSGWNLQQTVRAATMNPAKVVGLQQKGKIESGCKADIVALSPGGEVRATMIGGVLPAGRG